MKQFLGLAALTDILIIGGMMGTCLSVQAESPLSVVYPPKEHQTTAEKIFFIGTASPQDTVLINGKPIKNRSSSGHFAPSLPLKIGENIFTIRHQKQEIKIKVYRLSEQPEIPKKLAFGDDSLTPGVDIARLPNEPICFGAIAPPDTNVSVQIGQSKVLLLPQVESVDLPANSAVLTADNNPVTKTDISKYEGCTSLDIPRNYGKPLFELKKDGETITQKGQGDVTILAPQDIEVVEVIADEGVARTGASSDNSRLTPLPKGTRGRITGKEGEWLRLDYGGWIQETETKPVLGNILPQSIIRGITARQVNAATEVIFPLQLPVPVEVKQDETSITLSLYNTIAQTDTIRFDADPMIKRLDWQQVSPNQIDYTFELHGQQQWGYDLRYEGTSLIFSLRHPPKATLLSNLRTIKYQEGNLIESQVNTINPQQPLEGIDILLDPGHGGKESGAKGPTGYPEKDINLLVSKLVEQELNKLGATVYLTRKKDIDLSLDERVAMIDKVKPDLAVSIHYNALPDNGDAENTQGISTFWYNTQAHAPAMFLHNYLVTKLNRPDYGTYWNNLALTRPHTAPSILLELGFMINPEEFEWITNAQEQQKLAKAIAQGIQAWFTTAK
ncbi:MAG: N-acetylmuramoyl-L-alanine amidase [Waterburya sp.]